MQFTTGQLTEIVEVIESNGVPLKGVANANGVMFESETRRIVWDRNGITAEMLFGGDNETAHPDDPAPGHTREHWQNVITFYEAVDVADGLNALRLMNVIEHTEVIENEV